MVLESKLSKITETTKKENTNYIEKINTYSKEQDRLNQQLKNRLA